MKETTWNDERTARFIGILLRTGVLASALVVICGAVMYLLKHGNSAIPDYKTFRGATRQYSTVPGIVAGSLALDGLAIVQLGLLLLIATPVVRVLFSAIAFALEKDKLFVCITLIVLAILILSLSGFGPR